MSKKQKGTMVIDIVAWTICTILFLSTLVALKGAYTAHFGIRGMVFGSSSSSLSLIALALNIALWAKSLCWATGHCGSCKK
ncbi:hypothetical protein HN512_02605 [Candidatus Peregrinibacteria bacterium]|jgi:hypothetical protein|nr:hypothetical protein [Candidatus Peregrinibacteria bacterium]MBT3598703.1 hypothetical protein [Candidatus Peregrinibacteria bacterium]MBT4366786.1 hypothetical protein [Candidatus Peregrinibacteria bacterium]MBT4585733.1 hypothetical protein [Candidatus Peregrinibacteria bacterium]MBT6731287.1 hypothetical protein [Candidatus Peregrinibacteria bacterium]